MSRSKHWKTTATVSSQPFDSLDKISVSQSLELIFPRVGKSVWQWVDAGVPMDSKAKANGMEAAEATFLAAMYGHTNVIAILSERGADLNHTFMGMTVSEYATYSEHPEAANFIDAIIKK